MPKNKFQAAVFGVIMSYAMAIGMEVYNVALREGVQLTPGGLSNMTNSVFLGALEEAWYMGLFWWSCFPICGATGLALPSGPAGATPGGTRPPSAS